MAASDYDAQALRDLVETELELSDLLLQRAERARGRHRSRLYDQAHTIHDLLDADIRRLEQAWLRTPSHKGE